MSSEISHQVPWPLPRAVSGENFTAALLWETDFDIPSVLGGAALLLFSAPAVYKNGL